MRYKVLDCTLRDGGYVNNWDFSNGGILNIIRSLIESNIDIIECGFLNNNTGKEFNSSKFKDISNINILLKSIPETDKMFVAMINLGEYDLDSIPTYNSEKNNISGIRLAFHKKDFNKAIDAAKIIVKKGYRLFVQAMVTLSYSDLELLNLIETFNGIGVYSIYIVDSFGSMSKMDFKKTFLIVLIIT